MLKPITPTDSQIALMADLPSIIGKNEIIVKIVIGIKAIARNVRLLPNLKRDLSEIGPMRISNTALIIVPKNINKPTVVKLKKTNFLSTNSGKTLCPSIIGGI